MLLRDWIKHDTDVIIVYLKSNAIGIHGINFLRVLRENRLYLQYVESSRAKLNPLP